MTSRGGTVVGGIIAGLVHNARHLVGSVAAREARETRALYERVRSAYAVSAFAEEDAFGKFMASVVDEAFVRAGRDRSIPIGEALFETVRELLIVEGAPFGFQDLDLTLRRGPAEALTLRTYLRRAERFLTEPTRLSEAWFENTVRILAGILEYLPDAAFGETPDEDDVLPPLSVPVADLLARPAEVIERLIVTMFDQDIVDAEFFADTRTQIEENVLRASGIDPARAAQSSRALTFPTECRATEPGLLATRYLGNTPFAYLFDGLLPFSVPERARFEHCHVIGGTGHGKTQLLQFFAHRDLLSAKDDGRSVVVIDSQGDLLDTLIRRSYFDPETEGGLADRLVLIDPTDIEHPPALNLFDVNMERIEGFGALEREQVLNGTIELYEYLFGALLGAELTAKQGVIFKYLARLMLTIPGANLPTLLALMEDPEPFRPYVEALGGTARKFFETEFFSSGFAATRRQVARRLWSVLSLPTFERLFSQPDNKLDLFQAMNDGKVIFINTAKDLLKQEGCTIFGRFFIAMIAQAALQRAAIPVAERRPTFVYIDEAQEYFDESVGQLLAQARKFNVGMTLAHQNLDQVGTTLRAGIMANTSVKLAGGVSAKDASALAPELRCTSEFLKDMRKRRDHTEFACYVKDATLRALRLSVPLGAVSAEPAIDDAAFAALIEKNRLRYGAPLAHEPTTWTEPVVPLPKEASSAPAGPETVPGQRTVGEPPVNEETTSPEHQGPQTAVSGDRAPGVLGRGGREHTYLQQLITQAAQDNGYRATIEQPVGDGSGSVDVSLERGELKIACEVSVTTAPEQELQNVTKCLAAGYQRVLLVSPKARHLDRLKAYISRHIPSGDLERVSFLPPEAAVAHLSKKEDAAREEEATVRGYRVRVSQSALDPEEAEARRKAVAGVILRSMRRMEE